MSLHQFSRNVRGRALFGGHVHGAASFAAEVIRPGEHFVLFVAMDTCVLPEKSLASVAATAVRAGASYICCWGPECSRFHDVLEGTDSACQHDGSSERNIMTACQQGKSLEQALGFAVHVARPRPQFEASTRAVIAVAIANPAWASRIETYLAAGAPTVEAF